jgi:hypothetical protein
MHNNNNNYNNNINNKQRIRSSLAAEMTGAGVLGVAAARTSA